MHVIGYSVEQLSRDLCMERTGLYRKLVNLLDQSPSLFIRNIRLQRAAQLLTENELSIAEIAERTGFSSSSYLSNASKKCMDAAPPNTPEKQRNQPDYYWIQPHCCLFKAFRLTFVTVQNTKIL